MAYIYPAPGVAGKQVSLTLTDAAGTLTGNLVLNTEAWKGNSAQGTIFSSDSGPGSASTSREEVDIVG